MIRYMLLVFAAALAIAEPASGGLPQADGVRILVMLNLPPRHFHSERDYGAGYGDSATRAMLLRQARGIARRHNLEVESDWPMPLLRLDCVLMRLPPNTTAEEMVRELAADPHVQWSQPLQEFHALGVEGRADDPLYAAQPARSLWHLDALHRLATGRGSNVAVIDSGIDTHQPDLAGQVSANVNFVAGRAKAAEGHGTAVAGVIAARAGNRAGIVGVAPEAHLIGLRACWETGAPASAAVCDSFSLAKALHFAIERKIPIVNLSLTGPPDRLLASLIGTGVGRGISIVTAYDPARPGGGFPASVGGVIAVSGKPVAGRGRMVYTAPARGVPAPEPGGTWTLVNGTSFAAAHVSGLMALVRQREKAGSASSLLLVRGGKGAIDALATVEASGVGCDAMCTRRNAAARRP